MPSFVYVRGTLDTNSTVGDVRLRLDSESTQKMQRVESTCRGKTPFFGCVLRITPTRWCPAKAFTSRAGELLGVRCTIRRYKFRGDQGALVEGWRVYAHEIEDYR